MPLIAVLLPSLWVSSGPIIVQPTKYCCINLGLSCALTFFFGHNPSPAKSVLMYFSAHPIRLSVNSFSENWALLVGHVHKPLHPITQGTPATDVFFFPLTLQTMAWFWEHLQCTTPWPSESWGIFCTHPPLLRTNPVEWCNANFARPKRAEAERQAHHEQSPTRQYVERCCCAVLPVEGTSPLKFVLLKPEGLYIHKYLLKVRYCCMHISTHLGNWTKGYNGPAL